MARIIATLGLIVLMILLTLASVYCPEFLSDDGNDFLKGFVNHEFLSFLGVVVTITLASAASLHLEFNRLENGKKVDLGPARSAVAAYAILLIVLFASAFALVVLKPIFGCSIHGSAAFNSAAIVIVALNILALADLTLTVFRIPPDKDIVNADPPQSPN